MLLQAISGKFSIVYQTVPKSLFFFFMVPLFIDDFSFSDFIVSNGMMSDERPAAKICKGTAFP